MLVTGVLKNPKLVKGKKKSRKCAGSLHACVAESKKKLENILGSVYRQEKRSGNVNKHDTPLLRDIPVSSLPTLIDGIYLKDISLYMTGVVIK